MAIFDKNNFFGPTRFFVFFSFKLFWVRHLLLENDKKSHTRLFKLDFIKFKLKVFRLG
jgi:hypothetical protein